MCSVTHYLRVITLVALYKHWELRRSKENHHRPITPQPRSTELQKPVYRAKPNSATRPATSAPEPYVLPKLTLALESAVDEAVAEAPVAEALPEAEPVEEAVDDAAALLEELVSCDVTFLLPQVTEWQAA